MRKVPEGALARATKSVLMPFGPTRARAALALAAALMLLADIGLVAIRFGDDPVRPVARRNDPAASSRPPAPTGPTERDDPNGPDDTTVPARGPAPVRRDATEDPRLRTLDARMRRSGVIPPDEHVVRVEPIPPTNYIATRSSLSRARFPTIVTEPVEVPMQDGVKLYVEVTRPAPNKHGGGPWPVVMEVSPYHGTLADRRGTRIFPDALDKHDNQAGLTGYFAPRGYAVVMVDLRGTGRSGGCLDHLGPKDAQDIKAIVEWAASQPWSNGRVGMTGHSYVGSTPSLAAAMKPKGLVTIVPSAGLASMYDHQFQYGVPYQLQWAGPVFAYEQLALARHLPPIGVRAIQEALGPTGDSFAKNSEYLGCGLSSSAITGGPGEITGQYNAWHEIRDWREAAARADIPIFMVHGVNDDAARIPAAEWFFANRIARRGDKVWIGQWDHGSDEPGHPNRRYHQWMYALHAWFDKHLKQMDVDTGPAVEVFLNDERVVTRSAWGKPDEVVTFRPDASNGSFSTARPDQEASVSFGGAGPVGSTTFATEPLTRDMVMLGLPRLKLHASQTTAQMLHLIATLQVREPNEVRRPVAYCAIQPMLRNGVDRADPVIPNQEMTLAPQCFTTAHRIYRGEVLELTIGFSSPHHIEWAPSDARVTVYTGADKSSMQIPLLEAPKIYRDVPLRIA